MNRPSPAQMVTAWLLLIAGALLTDSLVLWMLWKVWS